MKPLNTMNDTSDPFADLTLNEIDALAIEEWCQAPNLDWPAMPSADVVHFTWAHENTEAWVLVRESKLNGLTKLQAMQLLSNATRSLRHLAGQHDQKAHGHGGGAGGYEPGAWKADSSGRDRALYRTAAKLEADCPPGLRMRLEGKYGRDWAAKQAEHVVNGQPGAWVQYRNGPHLVTFNDKRMDEGEQKAFLTTVDKLQTKYPSGHNVNIFVGAEEHFTNGDLAESLKGSGCVRVSGALLNRNHVGGMPASQNTPAAEYVLTHEWGHTLDPSDSAGTSRHTKAYRDAKATGELSPYGASHEDEAFAEAFAEFATTDGKTTNKAAQVYATEYNWG